MDNDKETKKKLIKSAKKEFLEKGYTKASLRNICKNAGVTTGALYFFFKDKDELFESTFGGAMLALKNAIGSHFNQETGADLIDLSPQGMKDDFESAQIILSVLFEYREEFDLLLNRSQGSRYENIVDEFVDMVYKHYLNIYSKWKGYGSKKQLKEEEKFIVHWMSHDQIDIFIHLLTHCKDEKQALAQMRNMFNYMVGGWIAVVNDSVIKE